LGAFFDELKLIKGQFLVASLRRRDRIRVFEIIEIKTANRKRIRADSGKFFVNIRTETLQNRKHEHKCRDGKDHPEKRQK